MKVVEELASGSLLQARWSVNLRENNLNTESGQNKSLLVIYDGECVRLEEKPELLRGSWWAQVSIAQCPQE